MSFVFSNPNEKGRLAALHSYHILDTLEEKDFDDLTTLAAAICQVPIALISLVDEDRQWFKSHKGLPVSETPIEQSFCAHAIVATDDITIIEDAHQDDRFKANPLVTGTPNITFYAGVPLVNEEGYSLGTLCVIDPHKKQLTNEQKEALKIVARQVMDKLELRKKVQTLQASNEALSRSEKLIQDLNTDLQISNARIKTFIEQAPVSIIVFRGENLFIEAVNEPMLQLLNKGKDILYKPLLKAIPELEDQPPFKMLYSVYRTGNPVYGYDTPVVLTRNGKQEIGYYNFSYTPLIENGEITGVIDMAVEVTGQVNARKQLEAAHDKIDMALDSAQLGVWSVDITNDALTISERARTIHGISKHAFLTLTESLQLIAEEYRGGVLEGIKQAIVTKSHFSAEYPINPMDGGPVRWLKSNGKAYYDDKDAPLYVTGTMLDITEQKQDEQRKNDFISMVSHELKTPLTSMSGYLQLLQYRATKTEDVLAASIMEKANKQARKMTAMINGFLNVARLESGKIYIDKQHFDMAELLQEAEEESSTIALYHKVVFAPVAEIFVAADRDKIGQVINNFISNAVKYSSVGSTIEVACTTMDAQIQVSVQDEGMGINQKDIDKLFDRFYRIENKQTKSIAGFGIGLYLCAEIIERHEGKIWVESEIGKGSIFYFSLPLAQ